MLHRWTFECTSTGTKNQIDEGRNSLPGPVEEEQTAKAQHKKVTETLPRVMKAFRTQQDGVDRRIQQFKENECQGFLFIGLNRFGLQVYAT